MPATRRPKLPRELFETRSHAWHSLGLGDELAPRMSRKALGGLLLALLVLAATLVVYYNRHRLAARLRPVGADRHRGDPDHRRLGGDALAGPRPLAAALPPARPGHRRHRSAS